MGVNLTRKASGPIDRLSLPAFGYLIVGAIVVVLAVLSLILLANPFGSKHINMPLPPQLLENPVQGLPADPNLALATVVAKIEFTLELPTYFPTSADRLRWANYGSHPSSGPQPDPLPDVMYIGDNVVTADDNQIHPALEIRYSVVPHHFLSPSGDVVSENFADYILYKAVNYKAADGSPVMVTYTAIHSPVSMSLVFMGEQPTMPQLEKMLKSFVPVTIPASTRAPQSPATPPPTVP